MIIDFHTHIFPPEIRQSREKYFSSEFTFKRLYKSPQSKMIGAKALVAAMDEHGVDKSVVFGFPWKNSETYRRHNDYVIESMERFSNRLIGFGCFDLFNPAVSMEAERCLNNGLFGIGELAFYDSGIDEESLHKLDPIMELCLKKDYPVLIHTNEPIGHDYPGKTTNTLSQIYLLVKRFSKNTIVLAHWGGGIFFFNLMKKGVKESLRNVYFDTAASPFLYDTAVYQLAVTAVGVEKILFGSDFPLLMPSRYFIELNKAELSKGEKDCICGENAARVLNL
jgi:predicted TIM-barrel fold metal-dependent hydrolase